MIAYYFCNMKTFQSLLNSKCLWLTDLTKSNDAEEVTRLYQNIWNDVKNELLVSDLDNEIVKANVEQIDSAKAPQIFSDIPFGCCMSYENDLSQQWIEYGDHGKGVSLGFELDWFGLEKQYPITSTDIHAAIGYEFIVYDSVRLRQNFYDIFYQAIKEDGVHAWYKSILPTLKHYAGFIKNPSFKDEKEIRFLYYPSEFTRGTVPGLSNYFEEKRPHYCLSWANDESSALRSITIGRNCKYSLEEIKELVAKTEIANIDSVKIQLSNCSYRDRIG